MFRFSIIVAAAVLATPCTAQDGQFDAAPSLVQGRLSQQIVDGQNRRTAARSSRAGGSARAREVCANRRAVGARLTAAKARNLEALCARAGYR